MNDLTITVYAGNILKSEEFISALDVQKYIADDIANGGHNLELKQVRDVLESLELAGFLDKVGEAYTFAHKNIKYETVVKNVMPFADIRVSLDN